MTYALFEDTGKILSGRLMSETDASSQIELDSGKRQKVKASHILLRFDKPDPRALLAAAALASHEIDLALAWEFAGEDEFGFADVARDYYSEQATQTEQVAMLLALHGAPHYFRRGSSKGRFKKADAQTLALALAAIERKKEVLAQIDAWALALAAGQCPEAIQTQLYKILFKPDKNAPEYKAVVQAARSTQTPPLVLLQNAGAIASSYQFHWQRFLFEAMPASQSGQGPASILPHKPDLTSLAAMPLAQVRAFSIDDSATTEIDDALSVQGLGTPEITLGIHIAAPSLGIAPDDAVDKLARSRLSTIYMPGHKITMLPDALVQPFTLQASQSTEDARPAVSLYVRYDAASLAVKGFETKIERVPVVANLRYDHIDHIVTADWLNDATQIVQGTPPELTDLRAELSWLFALAQTLKAQREVVRGKPETFTRPDYSFKLDKAQGAQIQGDERVEIVPRVRGAPLDLIVAEAMIVANSTWGAWLATLGVPAIYRSQASLAFGVKVRMGVRAAPHAGIGVPAYAWSTSPLRRYTDLVNQWQIIAAAKHGATAALVAPFKPKDVALFSIIASFEDAYANYHQFQNTMERYWTLKAVQQRGLTQLTASVMRDGIARADDLPLVLPVLGAQALPRGARVRVQLGEIDLIALEVTGTLLERLDVAARDEDAKPMMDEEADEADDEALLPAVALAIDVSNDDAEQDGAVAAT
ncbi:MAG: RNB domain-containing ribonuclease [Cytophagales bacterium]|nr:RNB domain-containing ribonuclease [Cytophagales bacterium]